MSNQVIRSHGIVDCEDTIRVVITANGRFKEKDWKFKIDGDKMRIDLLSEEETIQSLSLDLGTVSCLRPIGVKYNYFGSENISEAYFILWKKDYEYNDLKSPSFNEKFSILIPSEPQKERISKKRLRIVPINNENEDVEDSQRNDNFPKTSITDKDLSRWNGTNQCQRCLKENSHVERCPCQNAVIQFLSNTTELKNYLLNFPDENSGSEPDSTESYQQTVIEDLRKFLIDLWSKKDEPFSNKPLMTYLDQYENNPHELLTNLLKNFENRPNETNLNENFTSLFVGDAESDEEIKFDQKLVEEHWNKYLNEKNSHFDKDLTGQFLLNFQCEKCSKKIVRSEFFTNLSVPIGKNKRFSVKTILIYRDPEKSIENLIFEFDSNISIKSLKDEISRRTSLKPSKMFVYKFDQSNNVKILNDKDFLSEEIETFFIGEILISEEFGNEEIFVFTLINRFFKSTNFVSNCEFCQSRPNFRSGMKWCKNCYRVCYCNEFCEKFDRERHVLSCSSDSSVEYEQISFPFVVSLPKSKVNYDEIVKSIFDRVQIRENESEQRENSTNSGQFIFLDFTKKEKFFPDLKNLNENSIKKILKSSDVWSICRIGDFFSAKRNEKNLLRLVVPIKNFPRKIQTIVEENNRTKNVFRTHRTIFVDWLTENGDESSFRISSNKISIRDENLRLKIDVEQIFKNLTVEKISNSVEKIFCSRCKENTMKFQRRSIVRLPNILIINFDHRQTENYEIKFRFQIDQFDLKFFRGQSENETERKSSVNVYNLHGIISRSHENTRQKSNSVKEKKKSLVFRRFDQDQISFVGEETESFKSDVVVLFYRRQNQ